MGLRPPAMLAAIAPPALPTSARAVVARRGFSLVELLVVLGIIAAMAGLMLGGLFRSRDGNRLLAAEQILADAIRQGRHTARSTGAPVELRLIPTVRGGEVIGAKLSGVSQTILWSETFDGKHDSNEDGVIDGSDLGGLELPVGDDPPNGVVIGRSGNGRVAFVDQSIPQPIPVQTLPRGATIVRGEKTAGFYLACSVMPPLITNPLEQTDIALVTIGGDGTEISSQCGLSLMLRTSTIQNGPLSLKASVHTWDLKGWVYPRPSDPPPPIDPPPYDIFATRDAISSRIGREKWQETSRIPLNGQFVVTTDEFAHGITGGQWVDVGLLYDKKKLVLYLNGQRIAERTVTDPDELRNSGDSIYLGPRVLPTTPPKFEYDPAPIDDVRLYRLGGGDVAELPGNVVLVPSEGAAPSPTIGWHITCQPDGRVEAYRDYDSDPLAVNDRVVYEKNKTRDPTNPARLKKREGDQATILIGQLRAPGTIQNAELTVTLDGRVLSRLITTGNGSGSALPQNKP
jgi:prepilin-type N-terminal cleavage/methylation domain-containing protein